MDAAADAMDIVERAHEIDNWLMDFAVPVIQLADSLIEHPERVNKDSAVPQWHMTNVK